MRGNREQCLHAGMDAYIAKPVNSQATKETIERIRSGRQADDVFRESSKPDTEGIGWSPTDALRKLEGDEQLLRQLINIFLEESPRQLAILEDAIRTRTGAEVEASAHSLKGELCYLGLSRLEAQARSLEGLGQENSLAQASALFSSFKAEMQSVMASLREVIRKGESASV